MEHIMTNTNSSTRLAQSVIIDLKGRKVGSEDLRQASLRLSWADQEGFRWPALLQADGISKGLILAVELAEKGEHLKAAKQAGNCLWVLKKNRELAHRQNHQCLGSLVVECRDGRKRKIGDMVEWFASVHERIAEQIEEAAELEKAETERLAREEEAAVQFALTVAAGEDVDVSELAQKVA
jgi:hypothetical protein